MKKIILFSIALFALGMVGCSSDAKEDDFNVWREIEEEVVPNPMAYTHH